MSINNHRLLVKAIPANAKIYALSVAGWFPRYFYFDRYTEEPLEPELILDDCKGSLRTSKVRDQFRNRDCYNTYIEVDGTLGFNALLDTTIRDISNGTFSTRHFIRNGVSLSYTEINPGMGPVSAKGAYATVEQNTSTEYKYRYYGTDGAYNYTREGTVISITGLKTMAVAAVVTYKETTSYSGHLKAQGYKNTTYIKKYTVKPVTLGFSGNTTHPSANELKTLLTAYCDTKVYQHIAPESLTDDIFDNFTIPDVNNIENLSSLKNIKKSIPPIANLLRKRNIKSLAEFYLWYKYAYSTTVMDLEAYYNFFRKWLLESNSRTNNKIIRLSYNKTFNPLFEETHNTHYEIICEPYNVGVLQALGLSLNLSNTWDTLPFSFVVDWFINLGDILARIDHSDVLSKVNVKSVITSSKHIKNYYPLRTFGCLSPCRAVTYQRDISDTLPLGSISLSLKDPTRHITDGAALFYANKRS